MERVGRGFTLTFFPKTLGNNQVNDGRATHLLAVAVGEQVSSRIEQCHGLARQTRPVGQRLRLSVLVVLLGACMVIVSLRASESPRRQSRSALAMADGFCPS